MAQLGCAIAGKATKVQKLKVIQMFLFSEKGRQFIKFDIIKCFFTFRGRD